MNASPLDHHFPFVHPRLTLTFQPCTLTEICDTARRWNPASMAATSASPDPTDQPAGPTATPLPDLWLSMFPPVAGIPESVPPFPVGLRSAGGRMRMPGSPPHAPASRSR